jgi:hypothetical protein
MTYFFGLLTKTYIVRYSLFKLCKFAWILVSYFISKICLYKIFEDFFLKIVLPYPFDGLGNL